MKKLRYIVAISTLVIVYSCEDFLKPEQTGRYIPTTVTALEEVLLGSGYPTSHPLEVSGLVSIMDDDIVCRPFIDEMVTEVTGADPVQMYEAGPNAKTLGTFEVLFSWQRNFDRIDDFNSGRLKDQRDIYTTGFKMVSVANIVLDLIDGVSGDNKQRERVRAEARALRAFSYFTMVNLYGAPYNYNKEALAVPIVRDATVRLDFLPRNTVAEVYNLIIEDLLVAEKSFKSIEESDTWRKDFRASLPMVNLLLSRVYLYMEDWENAAKYAKAVMDDTRFTLLDLNTKTTATAVFDFTYMSYTNTEAIWVFGRPRQASFTIPVFQFSKRTLPTNTNKKIEPTLFNVSDELLNMYLDNDLRKERYMTPELFDQLDPIESNRKTLYRPVAKILIDAELNLVNISKNTDSEGRLIGHRAYRLSEAYLNYAEAMAMLYKLGANTMGGQEAIKTINTLRAHRFKAGAADIEIVVSDPDQIVNEVRNERRRELCFENHRWYDLRRQGMPEIKHVWVGAGGVTTTYTLQKNDKAYTLFLPSNVIVSNPSLQQNP